MHEVGLKVLKNKLSEYVRLAAAGETVVITDRGRPVAEIVPPRRDPESVIERGIREGWIVDSSVALSRRMLEITVAVSGAVGTASGFQPSACV
jgi:prevent-host-death family protein